MENVSTNIKQTKKLGSLTIFVIADSKSMDELHPSGLSKNEYVRQKMKKLLERCNSSVYCDEEVSHFSIIRSTGYDVRMELWPTPVDELPECFMDYQPFSPDVAPLLARGLETAMDLRKLYSKLQPFYTKEENWDKQIVLITDGHVSDGQKTIEMVHSWNRLIPFFIYYLPTMGDETFTGYEYCTSLGHTHKWIESVEHDRLEITVPMVAWDLSYGFLRDFFTGYVL